MDYDNTTEWASGAKPNENEKKYQFSESAEEMHAKASELESKTIEPAKSKPIWLTITDHEGVIAERINIADYNLSKSFARSELMDEIESAVEFLKQDKGDDKAKQG